MQLAHKYPQAVELMLEDGADLNFRNHQRTPTLHETASWGATKSATLLLRYGAALSIAGFRKRNFMLDGLGAWRQTRKLAFCAMVAGKWSGIPHVGQGSIPQDSVG